MSRSPLLVLSLFAVLACHPADDGTREGYLVLADDEALIARHAGDTLREVSLARDAAPVRRVVADVAKARHFPRECARVFASDSNRVVVLAPYCGVVPGEGGVSDTLWNVTESILVVSTAGALRFRSDTGGRGYAAAVLCPGERDESGKPVQWDWGAPDGCERHPPVGPVATQTPGIATPLGVIFPDALGRGLYNQCSRRTPAHVDGQWTPTPADVATLERELPAWLATNAGGPQLEPIGPLDDYVRQYGGFIRGGRRFIYASFALTEMAVEHGRRHFAVIDGDWQRVPIVVCDGGGGYWGVEYDVEAHRFGELHTNGVA